MNEQEQMKPIDRVIKKCNELKKEIQSLKQQLKSKSDECAERIANNVLLKEKIDNYDEFYSDYEKRVQKLRKRLVRYRHFENKKIQSLRQHLAESIPVFELQNWIMICGNLTDEQDEILTKFISFIQNYKPNERRSRNE